MVSYFSCLEGLGDLMAWRLGVTNVSRIVALGSWLCRILQCLEGVGGLVAWRMVA